MASAEELYWPPFKALFEALERLKLEATGGPAPAALARLLQPYEPWLARGLQGFRPPSAASRAALEGQAALVVAGGKRLPVEAGLRAPALELSAALRLDEVQAYLLLRRWLAGTAAAGGGALYSGGLSPEYRQGVAQLYWQERLSLLNAVEDLLWLGEGVDAGPCSEVIESTLSALLEAGLEESVFLSLRASLEGQDGPPARSGTSSSGAGSTSALVAAAAVNGSGGVTGALVPAFSSFGLAGSSLAAAGSGVPQAQLRQREEEATLERNSLLNILLLIYYHPRKQATPDRFLALARLFHARLFTALLPHGGRDAAQQAASPVSAQRSIKLAILLLLEMLDLDRPVGALAEGKVISQDNYVFAAPDVRGRVDAELTSWWPSATGAHSPVLLAWAAVLCLVRRSSADGSSGGADDFLRHANKAQDTDALGTLAALTTHTNLAPTAAEMYNNIVLSTMAATFCAFNFSPLTVPVQHTDAVVQVLCNLFRCQPVLCEGFWAEDRATDDPLRAYASELRDLFPALPAPLYSLLTALSSSPDAAASANAYLAGLPALTCLHWMGETGLGEDPNVEGRVVAEQPMPLPGAAALTLPVGIVGNAMPLPDGLDASFAPPPLQPSAGVPAAAPAACGLWTLRGGSGAELAADSEQVALVRWRLPLSNGTGQWVMLCRAFEALSAVHSARAGGGARAAAALCELSAALGTLATICSYDPSTAAGLLHLEIPAGGTAARGPDLLTLAVQAISMLAQLDAPPTAAIGDCFAICSALAQGGASGRVLPEVLAALQSAPTTAAAAAGSGDLPVLSRLVRAEVEAGSYPCTQAFLRLCLGLVSSAAPPASLGILVSYVLHRILAEHHRWRYVRRAERWRLAATALRVLRHALLAAPSPPRSEVGASGLGASGGSSADSGASAVAGAAVGVLQLDVGMATCLLTALPPHASVLERMSLQQQLRSHEELLAIEDCCVEWHRLLPVLLPAGAADAMLAPGAFFRPSAPPPQPGANTGGPSAELLLIGPTGINGAMWGPGLQSTLALDGAGMAGTSAGLAPAAILLSFITYRFFGSSELALVVRSTACIAAAAAATAPQMPICALLPHADEPLADSATGLRGGVHPAARHALAAALSPGAAVTTPLLFNAACDVVIQAVRHHPSLLDALLFPCALEQANSTQGGEDGGGAGAPAAAATGEKSFTDGTDAGADRAKAGEGDKKGAKPAKAAPPPHSCLDALYELLQRWQQLRDKAPAALAKLLQVVAALWQSGSSSYRAVSLLQRPPLWACVTGLLGDAAREGVPAGLKATPPGDGAEGGALAAHWAGQGGAAALLEAEGYALQVAAAECYSWAVAVAAGGDCSSSTNPQASLSMFAKQVCGLQSGGGAGGAVAAALLRRYCAGMPSLLLVSGMHRAAAAAGLQLLGTALGDEALWHSMGEGEGLLPMLAANAAPLLRQFGSQAEAARSLSEHADAVAARELASIAHGKQGGRSDPQPTAAVAAVLLQQAEVPGRLADDREFGRAFVYDAALFGRRAGAALVQEVPLLQSLAIWMEAVSVAASVEDARLAASTALTALLTALHRLVPPLSSTTSRAAPAVVGTPTAADLVVAAEVLAAVVGTVGSEVAASGRSSKAAVDVPGVHLLVAAEASKVVLLLLQRWAAAPQQGAVSGSRHGPTQVCTLLLELAREWLAAAGQVQQAASTPETAAAADVLTTSILSAALLALPLAAPAPAPTSVAELAGPQEQQLRGAGQQLLPLLLAACHPSQQEQAQQSGGGGQQRLALAASLAAALLERVVPETAWLPLLRDHLDIAALLASTLHRLAGGNGPSPAASAAAAAPTAASAEEAVLLLALQVAQAQGGPQLLEQQGVVGPLLSLARWLLAPRGDGLMAETPQDGAPTPLVDFSNAYRQDGSPNPVQRLWCSALSLLGLLLVALPGHSEVEQGALQLAVEAEPRLLLAVDPPAGSKQQPLTLAMAQEAKYSLFFLCALSRLSGQWRLALPLALPAFRRATAALLDFTSGPAAASGDGQLHCPPVSAAERAAAGAGSSEAMQLGVGWFAACAAGGADGARAAAAPGVHAWELASALYGCQRYALAFQLAVAPEVSEDEVGALGAEWVTPATLQQLQADCVDVALKVAGGSEALAAHPAVRRLCGSLQAALALSTALQDTIGVRRAHDHAVRLHRGQHALASLAAGASAED